MCLCVWCSSVVLLNGVVVFVQLCSVLCCVKWCSVVSMNDDCECVQQEQWRNKSHEGVVSRVWSHPHNAHQQPVVHHTTPLQEIHICPNCRIRDALLAPPMMIFLSPKSRSFSAPLGVGLRRGKAVGRLCMFVMDAMAVSSDGLWWWCGLVWSP